MMRCWLAALVLAAGLAGPAVAAPPAVTVAPESAHIFNAPPKEVRDGRAYYAVPLREASKLLILAYAGTGAGEVRALDAAGNPVMLAPDQLRIVRKGERTDFVLKTGANPAIRSVEMRRPVSGPQAIVAAEVHGLSPEMRAKVRDAMQQALAGIQAVVSGLDLSLHIQPCGTINAYATPTRVILCAEMINTLFEHGEAGALAFIIGHEFGHQYMRKYRPAYLNSEDLADEFGYITAWAMNKDGSAADAIRFLDRIARQTADAGGIAQFDPHTRPSQRARNLRAFTANHAAIFQKWMLELMPLLNPDLLKVLAARPDNDLGARAVQELKRRGIGP